MDDEIFSDKSAFSVNELSAMASDGDLIRYGQAFATWYFIETPDSRLKLLRKSFRARGNPVGAAALWVALGGPIPKEIELQEPRRKRYC